MKFLISKIGRRESLSLIPCFVVLCLIFAYTLQIRSPWFGKFYYRSTSGYDWLTASTVVYVKNWERESPWKLKWGMHDYPKSIEFSSLKERNHYSSYPLGTILPIYLGNLLTGSEINHVKVSAYNVMHQFLVGIAVFLLCFHLLLPFVSFPLAHIVSLIPASFYLLARGPMYFHYFCYFSDMAVALPVALAFLFESYRNRSEQKNRWDTALLFVSFWGASTDWYFFFVLGAIWFKRLLTGEISGKWMEKLKGSARFLWPLPTVFCMHLIHTAYVSGFDRFLGNGKMRFGRVDHFSDFFFNFIISFCWGWYFNYVCMALIPISILAIVYAYKRFRGVDEAKFATVLLGTSMLFAAYLQIYVLQNHSSAHYFSAMKMGMPVCLLAFALIPAVFASEMERFHWFKKPVFWTLLLLLPSYQLYKDHPVWEDYFGQVPTSRLEEETAQRFFDSQVKFENVVFSIDFEAKDLPPQTIAFTMKPVHRVSSIGEVKEVLAKIKAPGVEPMILFDDPPTGEWAGLAKRSGGVKFLSPFYVVRPALAALTAQSLP